MGELKERVKEVQITLEKKANMHEITKVNQQIGNLGRSYNNI